MDFLYSKLLKFLIFLINFVGILEMLCLFEIKFFFKKIEKIDRFIEIR